MLFEVNQLLLLISANSILTCLILFVLYFLFKEMQGTKEWLLASFLLCLAPLFLLSRTFIPHWISINSGHLLYFTAMAFFYIGVCKSEDKKINYHALFLVCITATLSMLITPKTSDYTSHRIFINASGIGLLALMSTLVLFKGIQPGEKGRFFLGLQFGIITIVQFVRATMALNQVEYTKDYFETVNIIEQVTLLLVVFTQTAYTAGFILVISENYRNRLQNKIDELAEARLVAERLATTDYLTGLCNRVKIEEVLSEQVALRKRYGQRFSIIMIDIDYFKLINDNFGHPAGDAALVKVANLLQDGTRETDICGRWGGEEFIIITPDTNCDGAEKMAENLRFNIEKSAVNSLDDLTASFGVAELRKGETKESLIKRADNALYKAKEKGRNCVVADN